MNYRTTLLMVLLILSDAVAQGADAPSARAESRNIYGYDPTDDFIAFPPSLAPRRSISLTIHCQRTGLDRAQPVVIDRSHIEERVRVIALIKIVSA